jgi:hypothetical protein
MAKFKYTGDQILRTTIAGKDLIVEPGAEFELDLKAPNAYLEGLKRKKILEEVTAPAPDDKK